MNRRNILKKLARCVGTTALVGEDSGEDNVNKLGKDILRYFPIGQTKNGREGYYVGSMPLAIDRIETVSKLDPDMSIMLLNPISGVHA